MRDDGRVQRPPDRAGALDVGLLAVAMAAVSTSGPLIAATAAPALAIAFWRTALAAGALAPALLRRAARGELRALAPGGRRALALASLALAVHFAAWVPSLSLTTVSAATALVCTTPVWAALLAAYRGEYVPARTWAGIAVALAGVLLLGGVDVGTSARAVVGDLLALLGGMAAAVYVRAGERVRRSLSATGYAGVCFAGTALLLLATSLLAGVPLHGYPAGAWARIVALAVVAQLIGHGLVGRLLRPFGAVRVAVALLFEVPGATLLAAVFLHQRPGALTLLGVAVVLAGVAFVVAAPGQPLGRSGMLGGSRRGSAAGADRP